MGKMSRGASFVYCGLVYLIALLAGYFVFRLCAGGGLLLATFLADIAATIVVWFFGLLFRNASLYDPYWSVAPLIILPLWLWTGHAAAGVSRILFLIAVYIWGLRLTYNWASRWEGLSHQDWRYTMLRDKKPRLYFVTNLMGINIMPTVLVFLGMAPVYYAADAGGDAGLLTYIGFAVCIGAALIQAVSDRQLDAFKQRGAAGAHMDTGLWRLSRPPIILERPLSGGGYGSCRWE